MTKHLLTLLAASAATLTAFSASPAKEIQKLANQWRGISIQNTAAINYDIKTLRNAEITDVPVPAIRNIATRADETPNMTWGYCGNPTSAFRMEDMEVGQAIYVAPEFTDILGGTEIRSIMVGNPVDFSSVNPLTNNYGNAVKTCNVFITDSLGGKPIIEMEAALTDVGAGWSTITLETPFKIEQGKPFYVGYSYTLPDDDCCGYISDNSYPTYDGTNFCYTSFTGQFNNNGPIFGEEKKWQNMGYSFPGNACIRLQVYGDNLPTNIVEMNGTLIPPYIKPDEKLTTMMIVKNNGANTINNLELTFQYEGEEPQTVTSGLYLFNYNYQLVAIDGIGYGESAIAIAEFPAPKKEGNYKCTLQILKLNGESKNNADATFEKYLLCLAEGYHKNVVLEEGTGTWCGYCPRGWAGMEHVKETYTKDGVIGVALHEGDSMAVLDEGQPFFDIYAEMYALEIGFPSAFFNRNLIDWIDPSPENFDDEIPYQLSIPAMSKINATLSATDNASTVKLTTSSEFLFDGAEGEYEIAYTVLEDNVGPYRQKNYFSGEEEGTGYGFETKPETCYLMYNDVARKCSQPLGIAGSLPAVEKGKTYDYECNITLTGVKKTENCRVVAMIVNKKSGWIENACMMYHPSNTAAVNEIASDKSSDFVRVAKGGILIDGDYSNVNIYNVAGAKVAKANGYSVSLPAGIYIVTRGSESAKVIVK